MANSPEYKIWNGMLQRCHNPKSAGYENYGGRGIHVCEEWQRSFVAFFSHVGKRPTVAHSLNRIDNNIGYKPGNVGWALASQQMRNTTRNRLVHFDGGLITVTEAAERLGWSPHTLHTRLWRGWSLEETTTIPRGSRNRWHKHPWAASALRLAKDGKTINEIAIAVGSTYHNVYRVLQRQNAPYARATPRLRKPPLDMRLVKAMFVAGYTIADIAERQHSSRFRVWKAIEKEGLKRRRPYATSRRAMPVVS
jgi:hypothetical protein